MNDTRNMWKKAYEAGCKMCPRCGEYVMYGDGSDALSRIEDMFICSKCGMEEALGGSKSFEDWYVCKSNVTTYEDEKKGGATFVATIPVAISNEDIDDIMTTALEGGITYWCVGCKVVGEYLGEWASEQISRDGILELEDEDGERYALTKAMFVNGVKVAIEDGIIDVIDNGIDTSEIDACGADSIIQLALFGEVIYG